MKKSELRQIIREEILKESSMFAYWEDVYEDLIDLKADKNLLNSVVKKYKKYVDSSFEKNVDSKEVAKYIMKKG